MDGAENDIAGSANERPAVSALPPSQPTQPHEQPAVQRPAQDLPSSTTLAYHARNNESFSRSRASTGLDTSIVNEMFEEQSSNWPNSHSDFPEPAPDQAIQDFNAAFASKDSHGSAATDDFDALIHGEPADNQISENTTDATSTLAITNSVSASARQETEEPQRSSNIQNAAENGLFAENGQDDDWLNTPAEARQDTEELFGAGPSEPPAPALESLGSAADESATLMTTDMPSRPADETMEELKHPLVEHEFPQSQQVPPAPADEAFLEAAKSVSGDLQQPEQASQDAVVSDAAWIDSTNDTTGDSWTQALGADHQMDAEASIQEKSPHETASQDQWAQALAAETTDQSAAASQDFPNALDASDDPWAKALAGEDEPAAETSWETAFGDELDEDGFLDEDGLLEDDTLVQSSEPVQPPRNPYAPSPTLMQQASATASAAPLPANLTYGAPQPNPIQEQPRDRAASGGMKFFEDLPMTQPARARRPKQQLVSQNSSSGPAPPPSLPPPGPARQPSVTSQQQGMPPFRGPEKLDLFPPQPNNAATPSNPTNNAQAYSPALQPPAPQSKGRYSPAPAQSPPVTSKYSAAPPARGPTPNARYSPAAVMAQNPQASAVGAGSPYAPATSSSVNAPPGAESSYFPSSSQPAPAVPSPGAAGQSTGLPVGPPSGPPRQASQYTPARSKSPASMYDPMTSSASQPPPAPQSSLGNRFAPTNSSPLAQLDSRPQLDRSATLPPQAQNARQDLASSATAPPGRNPALQRATTYAPQNSIGSTPSPLNTGTQASRVSSPPSPFRPTQSTQIPPRPRTQSPILTKGGLVPLAGQLDRRSSVPDSTPEKSGSATYPPVPFRARGPSVSDDVIYVQPDDPVDASDPLQRWKGAPIIHWSTSGLVSSQFPKRVPRYGGGQAAPAIKCSPGEVKLQKTKDIIPIDDPLRSFPGPLKSKSKKKDLLGWLSGRIEVLQRELSSEQSMSLDPRPSERFILWQLMRIFVDNDGILAGNPSVDNAVRQVLGASEPSSAPDGDEGIPSVSKPDSVDSKIVVEIRRHLLVGDREKAVWLAVDNRLWGHAMLISSTMDGALWKQVAQEFVRSEVRKPAGENQSLAALYQSFAHNWDETVDELVPASARAGFQMVPTADLPNTSQNALNGLNKWQETLSLILSNRSAEDERSLVALGKLLRDYGRLEAAHTCFLFSRNVALFGGSEEPDVNFTLLGADVSKDASYDMECILLSEVYEFALSLAPAAQTQYIPHLQAYKLHHAYALAECGLRSEALQYCEAVTAAMKSTTRMSPYYHPILVNQLDDLTKRLSQSPKDSASSWISKPSIGKVGGNMWAKFNSFVAGDEDVASNGSGYHSEPEVGPFSRLGPGTPTISRNPSHADLTAFTPMAAASGGSRYAPAYGGQSQPQFTPVAAGPYAPSTSSYAPAPAAQSSPRDIPQASSMSQAMFNPPVRSDSFGAPPAHHNPYQPANHLGISDTASQGSSSYDPPLLMPSHRLGGEHAYGSPPSNFSDRAPSSHGEPSGPHHEREMSAIAEEVYDPTGNGYSPAMNGYGPTNDSYAPQPSSYEPSAGTGYEPPGGGYGEPSGYTPYEPEPDSPDVPKSKKKSFMDDDDDDYKPKKAQPAKSREPDDAVRKAAEADAARDKAEKSRRTSGWLGGWFGGKKDPNAPTPTKATLGDELSFYYDPETKKWVNKKAGAEQQTSSAAPTPPPPRSGPPSSKPPSGVGTPDTSSGPPMRGPPSGSQLHGLGLTGDGLGPSSRSGTPARSEGSAGPDGSVAPPPPPGMGSLGLPVNPPSRPATSMSNASSIDDLIGAPAARKGGTAKKGKKGGRYVDVMAK